MRDIPLFETMFGTAGLVLNQIPCTGIAYIHIQKTDRLREMLGECVGFCKAAGARIIYACGDDGLSSYPRYTDVIRMTCPLESMEDTDAYLLPVTEETCEKWKDIYNERMSGVDNAAILTSYACRKLVEEGGAYFVHRKGKMLGIGLCSGEEIKVVASVVPGQGKTVVNALSRAICGPMVVVEVASTNRSAVRLYENMGFLPAEIIRSWYRVL